MSSLHGITAHHSIPNPHGNLEVSMLFATPGAGCQAQMRQRVANARVGHCLAMPVAQGDPPEVRDKQM